MPSLAFAVAALAAPLLVAAACLVVLILAAAHRRGLARVRRATSWHCPHCGSVLR